jgi:hypothetical protein
MGKQVPASLRLPRLRLGLSARRSPAQAEAPQRVSRPASVRPPRNILPDVSEMIISISEFECEFESCLRRSDESLEPSESTGRAQDSAGGLNGDLTRLAGMRTDWQKKLIHDRHRCHFSSRQPIWQAIYIHNLAFEGNSVQLLKVITIIIIGSFITMSN